MGKKAWKEGGQVEGQGVATEIGLCRKLSPSRRPLRRGLKEVRREPGRELGDGVSIPGRGNSKSNFAEAGVCLESSRKSKDLRLESHVDSCGPGVLEF